MIGQLIDWTFTAFFENIAWIDWFGATSGRNATFNVFARVGS